MQLKRASTLRRGFCRVFLVLPPKLGHQQDKLLQKAERNQQIQAQGECGLPRAQTQSVCAGRSSRSVHQCLTLLGTQLFIWKPKYRTSAQLQVIKILSSLQRPSKTQVTMLKQIVTFFCFTPIWMNWLKSFSVSLPLIKKINSLWPFPKEKPSGCSSPALDTFRFSLVHSQRPWSNQIFRHLYNLNTLLRTAPNSGKSRENKFC